MPDIGHNSNPGDARLRSIVERIERLEVERAELAEAVKEVYVEAKSAGYDVKVLRALIAERKKDGDEADRIEALLATYRAALGGLADMPLGVAALGRVSV